MSNTPLVQQSQPSRQSMATTVFTTIVRKNIRMMLRDKAALRRETLVTVVYFGLLIFLNTLPSYVPPLAPGHVVNPAFTATTLSDPIDNYDGSNLISEYGSGRTHVAVAPCVDGLGASATNVDASGVLTDLETNYPSLHDTAGFEYPLNWTCFPTKEALLHEAHLRSNILAGIVFSTQDPTLLTFELHFNHTLTPSTVLNFSASAGIPVNSTQQQWLESGIVALQHSVQMSVTRVAVASKKKQPLILVESLTFRQEPFDEYRTPDVGFTVGSIAPMYYVIIAAITSQSWMKIILEEKEKQVCLFLFLFFPPPTLVKCLTFFIFHFPGSIV
jgi:hypothetical protein